ncbi:MAG: hypothetical protein RML14_02585 [Meiothermus sp.]|uniref:hypothetical protein n=1 Tax=Meiothermus sp. TaxID=1955249 RepID=UPI00298EED57|nr:hypothetical protein [Meiothermus sp.]MDW8480788.1 hypothetical protein [Meiothermus sp.]
MGRKYLLSAALAGLALGLSGCLVLVESPAVSNFRFDSNWQRRDTGAYVFCSNRETLMRYRFRAPDSSLIQRIEERYEGFASGKDYTEDRPLGAAEPGGERPGLRRPAHFWPGRDTPGPARGAGPAVHRGHPHHPSPLLHRPDQGNRHGHHHQRAQLLRQLHLRGIL